MLKICRVWAIVDKMEKEQKEWGESKEKVSDVRVQFLINSHLYGYKYVHVCTLPGGCAERPS